LIFSLLKIRKKTAGVLAGIAAGLACVWVVAAWQDLTVQDLFNMLLGSVFFVGGIMLAAICIVAVFTVLKKLLQGISRSE